MATVTARHRYSKVPLDSIDRQSKPSSKNCEFRRDDYRFEEFKAHVPWPSVFLALGLMLFGLSAFIVAWLHVTQEFLGKEGAEIGFTILGLLMFLPGFYHSRIAYYTWRGYRGFSWDRIPGY